MKAKATKPKHDDFSRAVGRSLRRAAKAACKIARMYGTPIYILKDGKVVAEKPCDRTDLSSGIAQPTFPTCSHLLPQIASDARVTA